MTDVKNFFLRRWEILLTTALIIFNVGYTVARIESKPDRDEVKREISSAVKDHEARFKETYIRIDQVPGLLEKLEAINSTLESLGKRFEKLEDKIIYRIK